MKKFLIVLNVLAIIGFSISTAKFAVRGNELQLDAIVSSVVLIVINSLCSAWLYNRAEKYKVEWALLGFIGNLTALLSFWLLKDVMDNWKRGKRNFS
ncbi:MAG: hypothetical protein HXX11_11905 [Desulfuromonadales bacterium]|nr:hypothetical protein [Desulfuromonadales bacterium]